MVPGGAADRDGRLQAGDLLLSVDGVSLAGITQEKAAEFLVRTDNIVTLQVAKGGAVYHGLATLLQQPSPTPQRGKFPFHTSVLTTVYQYLINNNNFNLNLIINNNLMLIKFYVSRKFSMVLSNNL